MATVVALVALGSLTAAPAAADVNVRITVIDGSTGAALANRQLQFGFAGQSPYYVNTDVSGGFGWGGVGWPDADYALVAPDSSFVTPAPVSLDASSSQVTITLQKYRVTGSIPAEAGSTGVLIEQNSGGNWSVVDSTTVSAGFSVSLPNGAGQYRLRFQPVVGSAYLETLSSTFEIDGSVASVSLGDLLLNRAPTISGTVLAVDGGAPLNGATVHATINGTDVATAQTNASGAYSIRLPAGDALYTVSADAYGFDSVAYADTVAVNATAGYFREPVDFALTGTLLDITGTVGNYYSFNFPLSIQLYSGGATPTLMDQTVMEDDGGYSFPNIASGDYFIKFVPNGDDSYLPTLLGADNDSEWASTPAVEAAFALNDSFTVDVGNPSTATGRYVVLDGAAILRGTLRDNNDPIDGCVLVTDVNDPTFSVCAEQELAASDPDSDGWWSLRVPVGGTYTLYASDSNGEYTPQWWEGADTEGDATPVGPVTFGLNGYYQFFLDLAPAELDVTASDIASVDAVTAVVYYKDSINLWRLLGAADSPAVFSKDHYSQLDEGLAPGDYRIRFQNSDGTWLAATSYTAGTATVAGPACFIDVDGITDGAPTIVSASFDSANQTELCGPEVLSYGDVSGHVVSSPTYGSEDVANHYFRIYNDRSSLTLTTQADGSFFYSDLQNDSYDIEVLPKAHVAGEHEYTYTATDLDLGDGDVDLGTLVATRYGNVTGTISDWDDATMSGATATVYVNAGVDDCGCWTPGPLSVEISSTGEFEVPGIDADGDYAVRVNFPDTYAPIYLGGGLSTPTNPFAGEAEQDYDLGSVPVNAQALVTISGTVLFGATPVNGVVIAIAEGTEGETGFVAFTDAQGHYELKVAPGVTYEVIAFDGSMDLLAQANGGFNYDFRDAFDLSIVTDYTPLEVDAADVGDINFSLAAYNEVDFDLYLDSWDPANGYNLFEGVTAHLYRDVAGIWTEISTFDSDGDYAEAYGQVLGDGDYRVRFSKDGQWLAMHDLYSGVEYPYADDVETELAYEPAQCFYDFGSVQHGSYVYAEISLLPTAAPACDPSYVAAPAAVPGAPVKTGKPHHLTTPTAVDESTVAGSEEPTATPTPTPSTTPSDTATAEPGDKPAAAAPAAASSPDLTWLFVVAGLLVLLVLAGGAVFVVRRRA